MVLMEALVHRGKSLILTLVKQGHCLSLHCNGDNSFYV